jgi:hypothetical protein
LSAFEKVGNIYLAGSRKSLKIVVEGKTYFVHVKDVRRALEDAGFKAHILRLVTQTQPKPIELNFSRALKEAEPGGCK